MRRNKLVEKFEVARFECPECEAGMMRQCVDQKGRPRERFHQARWDYAEHSVRVAESVLAARRA